MCRKRASLDYRSQNDDAAVLGEDGRAKRTINWGG